MNKAVIGVGSNIEPQKHISNAQRQIQSRHTMLAVSTWVETLPIGITNQPNFLNGAMLIETTMNQNALKSWLSSLEDELGRDRNGEKFGPRTIDLDIVVWNGVIVDDEVYTRDFLRDAVLEVCPNLEPLLQTSSTE